MGQTEVWIDGGLREQSVHFRVLSARYTKLRLIRKLKWMKDALGQRGEAIFTVLITKFDSDSGPIFKPQFLGDKWPNVDFIVELAGVTGSVIPYFFVQVKTTRQGRTQKDRRLKVSISKRQVAALAAYPAPTYIVGIDEVREEAFIVSANTQNLGALSSLSTQWPIDRQSREALWHEVHDFWNAYENHKLASKFTDSDWR